MNGSGHPGRRGSKEQDMGQDATGPGTIMTSQTIQDAQKRLADYFAGEVVAAEGGRFWTPVERAAAIAEYVRAVVPMLATLPVKADDTDPYPHYYRDSDGDRWRFLSDGTCHMWRAGTMHWVGSSTEQTYVIENFGGVRIDAADVGEPAISTLTLNSYSLAELEEMSTIRAGEEYKSRLGDLPLAVRNGPCEERWAYVATNLRQFASDYGDDRPSVVRRALPPRADLWLVVDDERFRDWLADPRRKEPSLAFTAGAARRAADVVWDSGVLGRPERPMVADDHRRELDTLTKRAEAAERREFEAVQQLAGAAAAERERWADLARAEAGWSATDRSAAAKGQVVAYRRMEQLIRAGGRGGTEVVGSAYLAPG